MMHAQCMAAFLMSQTMTGIELLCVSASGSEPDFPARRRRGAPAVAIDYGHGRGHRSQTDSFATSEACLGPVEGFAPGGIRTWDLSIPAQLHNQLRNPLPLNDWHPTAVAMLPRASMYPLMTSVGACAHTARIHGLFIYNIVRQQ